MVEAVTLAVVDLPTHGVVLTADQVTIQAQAIQEVHQVIKTNDPHSFRKEVAVNAD